MTMFSQKEPLNLAEFLAQPASKDALRLMADRRRRRGLATLREKTIATTVPAATNED